MKVNSYIKSLNKAKKDYPSIEKYINNYESGLITFDECLLMVYSQYHAESLQAAIIENRKDN